MHITLIWCKNTLKQNKTIESVQNNFLRFIAFKFNIPRPVHGTYENINNFLNLCPLNDRRLLSLSKFLHNLILCNTICPELLSIINFNINSQNTRNHKTFYPVYSTKNYIINCPANLFMVADNRLS